MKKIKMNERNKHLKSPVKIKAILLLSVGLTLFSCAKNKELETVYKEPETIERNSLVSTDDTYLYVPSTLQVPRAQGDTRAYFQGDEKLVKFKYSEKNLEIFELDSDSRFSGNELNSSPVISIPVAYKDYKCKENAQKECSQKEEENNETTWNNKKFVLPDYSSLKINEINTLDLISVDPNCANLTNTKLVNYEVNSSTLNIELERTYQMSSDMRCIYPLYANGELGNASFKVRYFYSFVKLSSVTTPDFQPFVYEKEDQRTFGFFKTEIKKLNKFFDFARIEKQFLANHWNPNRKSIDFYLDPKFYNEENKLLLDATEESFQKINDGLKQAGAQIQINIAGKATHSSGDIRFSRINLLDEPQASGLLGYGPTIANPLTGEIVQAHVNMYSGVLTQTIRSTYESMVDLGVSQKKKSSDADQEKGSVNRLSSKIQKYNASKNFVIAGIAQPKPIKVKMNLADAAGIHSILDKSMQKKSELRFDAQTNNVDINSLSSEEDKNNLIRANRKMCDADLINIAKIAKKELPNIRNIPGVVSDEGELVAWDLLTDEAKQAIFDLILPKAYIQTLVHEIGHTLGLRHNFMGSYDKENFYTEEESKACYLCAF
ncbi:MAG: zinc-dependent metalloprotease [Bdellovibrionales bacterium]|nr:zinc-dependent metalloprotease [Bdellovibrionales bacterium]